MKNLFLLVFTCVLLSCSNKDIKPEKSPQLIIGPQPTAEDFHQLYDSFQSILLIFNDDELEPEAGAFLNRKIEPRWEDNAYVYLWGADKRTDNPYATGLEIAQLIKQADENYQYQKVPYDDSFLYEYEVIENPEGDFLCKSTEVGCLGSLFSEELERNSLVSDYGLFSERYLTFLQYPFMDEVSLKHLESPIPGYQFLTIGQRIHHLSLIEKIRDGKDIIPELLQELGLIRLKLTQGASLISKMIMHLMASNNIDLLNYLIQNYPHIAADNRLKNGIARLTQEEISTERVLKLEHQSGLRLFKEFLGDVELMVADKPRKPYVIPFMRVLRLMLAKPNMTINAHYHFVIKPLLELTELNASEFYEKYHSTDIQSQQNCLRNYVSCFLLDSIGDFKSMYLSYQGRMYSLDMKIQLLNALLKENSIEAVIQKANSEARYLNTYDKSLPYIAEDKICYNGIFNGNDKDRCLEIFKTANDENNVPVFRLTREQIDGIGVESVGQMMMVLSSKLPIPDGETSYQSLVDQIKQTDNEIIEDKGDYIIVQSYQENEESGEKEPSFKTKYIFSDGILIRGPVLVDPENMKVKKVTGKRVK